MIEEIIKYIDGRKAKIKEKDIVDNIIANQVDHLKTYYKDLPKNDKMRFAKAIFDVSMEMLLEIGEIVNG